MLVSTTGDDRLSQNRIAIQWNSTGKITNIPVTSIHLHSRLVLLLMMLLIVICTMIITITITITGHVYEIYTVRYSSGSWQHSSSSIVIDSSSSNNNNNILCGEPAAMPNITTTTITTSSPAEMRCVSRSCSLSIFNQQFWLDLTISVKNQFYSNKMVVCIVLRWWRII